MDNTRVRVGLFGLGAMGQNHLRILSILKNVELAFLYDADTAKAEALAAAHGTRACAALEAAWSVPVDAVVICTPTSTHAQYVHAAASHAKHLFVEKPMAQSVAQAEEICALARAHGLHMQVGFIERFNPAVQQLKQVLDASAGAVNLDFTRTNKLSSRITDVDVISDLMIHDIDLALHLNGPAESVTAYGVADRENGLVGFASASITHRGGRFSRLLASRMTEKKIRKIEATCDGLFVDCELVRKEIIVNRQSQIHQREGEAYRISAVQENIEVKPQEALLLELQSFVASCLGAASAVAPSAQDALAAIRIAEEIQQRILAP